MYRVIEADDRDRVEEQVTAHLKKGWTLAGGVQFGAGIYYQAVTLPAGENETNEGSDDED